MAALLAALLALAVLPGAARAATVAVDDDGRDCADAQHDTIQSAIDAADPGDTVAICPGTYVEGTGAAGTSSLVIRKSLTIKGAGADEVTIRPAERDDNPGSILEPSPALRNGVGDVVAVIGAAAVPITVAISGVTVSGGGVQVEAGVVFIDAQGSLSRSRVTNVVTSDLASAETVPGGYRNGDFGVGVAQLTTATAPPVTNPPRTLTVQHTRIDRYNKTGLLIDGATADTPPLTASGVPNAGVVAGTSIVGRNRCTNAAQTGNCATPSLITTGRLFGQDGIKVTAGASVTVTDSLVSQNQVNGDLAPVPTTQTTPGGSNPPPIPPLVPSTTNNANLALGSGIRLIGAAASSATRSNIVDNSYGVYNVDADGTTANTTTPFEAEDNWWGLRYFPNNAAGPSPNNPLSNPGPEVSPTYNPPIPENPVNGTASAEGSDTVDFTPFRNGFQGDPYAGQYPVVQAPLPVNDTAPTVSLAASTPTAARGATVTLTATPADDFGISTVTFYDGAELLGTAPGGDPVLAFEVPLDAPCAARELSAVATDSSGQTAASTPVTLTVTQPDDCQPPKAPEAPPTPAPIVITQTVLPPEGPSVPGELPALSTRGTTVTVSPVAPAGVAQVDFFIGDRRVCSVTAAPYRCLMRPTGAEVGTQVLRVVVTDRAGRSSTSARTVTVSRFTAVRLSLVRDAVRLRRGRGMVASGELGRPAGVSASQGCRSGRVTLVLRRNGSSIANEEVALRDDCTYRRTFALPARKRGTTYTLSARFGGNGVLTARSSQTRRFS